MGKTSQRRPLTAAELQSCYSGLKRKLQKSAIPPRLQRRYTLAFALADETKRLGSLATEFRNLATRIEDLEFALAEEDYKLSPPLPTLLKNWFKTYEIHAPRWSDQFDVPLHKRGWRRVLAALTQRGLIKESDENKHSTTYELTPLGQLYRDRNLPKERRTSG